MAAQVDPSAIEYNDLDYEDFNRKAVNPKNIDNPQDLDDDFGMRKKGEGEFNSDLFAMEETDSGVQWTAVKPFIGALVAPTNAPPNNPTKPDEDLKLEVRRARSTLARARTHTHARSLTGPSPSCPRNSLLPLFTVGVRLPRVRFALEPRVLVGQTAHLSVGRCRGDV
jgi:hypothetical protein